MTEKVDDILLKVNNREDFKSYKEDVLDWSWDKISGR
jgi:hypothetical protein